jgi:hypothetical protein
MRLERFILGIFVAALVALAAWHGSDGHSLAPASAEAAGASCAVVDSSGQCAEGVAAPAAPGDADNDGVCDGFGFARGSTCRGFDLCPGTAAGATVDRNGCSQRQVDSDGDGVCDFLRLSTLCHGWDFCPGTAPGAAVDQQGCSQRQVDSDGDGVCNPLRFSQFCHGQDACPNTPPNTPVDARGCPRPGVTPVAATATRTAMASTATSTNTATATRTVVAPTATNTAVPTNTSTATPTRTAVPPTATFTATATHTATPTNTPSPTPTPPPTGSGCPMDYSYTFADGSTGQAMLSMADVNGSGVATLVFTFDPTNVPTAVHWTDQNGAMQSFIAQTIVYGASDLTLTIGPAGSPPPMCYQD